jgi:hypothetical protein
MCPLVPICAHMRPHVPTCAHLCPHVPTCAHLCPYVPTCAHMCPLVPTCAHLCPHVPTCAHLCPISILRFQCFKTARLLAGSNLYPLKFLCLLKDTFFSLITDCCPVCCVAALCLFTFFKKNWTKVCKAFKNKL